MSRPYRNYHRRRPADLYRMATAADVRARIDARTFYETELGRTLPARSGWVGAGLCPFHDDRHAGSFRVDLGSGAFYCHACEAKGGSVIDFLALRDGLTFVEALRALRLDWIGGGV